MFQKVKAQKQISTTLPITSEMKELYDDRARLQEDKIKLLEEKIQSYIDKVKMLEEKLAPQSK